MGKIGDGHLSAFARQGLKEVRSAIYPQSNVASPTEYGMYGTQTPGEVADAREGSKELDEEKSSDLLNSMVERTAGRNAKRDQSKDMDK